MDSRKTEQPSQMGKNSSTRWANSKLPRQPANASPEGNTAGGAPPHSGASQAANLSYTQIAQNAMSATQQSMTASYTTAPTGYAGSAPTDHGHGTGTGTGTGTGNKKSMAEVILDMHFAQKAQQAEQAKQAQQAQQGIQSPQVAQSQQGQQGQQSTQFPRFSHGYQSIHGNVATMNSLGQAGPSNKFAPTTKDKGKSVQRVHNVANNTHGPGASSNLRTLPPPKPQSHAVRMEQQAMLLEFLKAGSLDPSVFSPAELPGKSGGLTWPRTRVEKSNEMPKGNEHPNSPLRQQVMGLVLTSTPDPTGRRESPFGSIGSKIMPPRPPIPASIRRMSPSKQSSIGSGISLPSPQVGSRNVAPGPPTGTNFPPPGLANAGNVFPTGTSFTPPGPANTSNVFASAQMDGPNNSTMAQHVSPLPAHNSAHSTHSLPIIDSNEEGTQLSVRDEIVTPMPGSSSDGNLMGGNMRYPSGPQMQAAGAVVQYQQPGNADIVHHQQPDNGTMVIRQPEVPSVGPMDYAPPSEGVQPNRSDWLNFLTREARPGLEELLYWGNMPFVETCELAQPSTHGVVQITNIPYNVTRAEVIAFLGRNSRILNDTQEPVHIIMDRITSKTLDCYVEFMTFQDAISAIARHQNTIDSGRLPRIGARAVGLTLSSEALLMRQLFPIARGVDWSYIPHRVTTKSRYSWENFKTFITDEEMTMLLKHVENPERSPFSNNCPERGYECMISTLKKMPWYMTTYITVSQRSRIYGATVEMVSMLQDFIEKHPNHRRLTPQLLNRLAETAIQCPGFSVFQKEQMVGMVNMPQQKLNDFNHPRTAIGWTHQWTLGPKPGVPMDVVEYYIALIREETWRIFDQLSPERQKQLEDLQKETSDYWGFYWCEVGFPDIAVLDNMTLSQVAAYEWAAIKRILRRSIQGGKIPNY